MSILSLQELMTPAIDGDIGGGLLAQLYPSAISSPPLWAVIGVFSAFLVLLGTVMLTWLTGMSIIQTAEHGRAGGRSMHQIFTPLRVVLGFGMLIPVDAGLPMAADVVYRLAIVGNNLARDEWITFVGTVAGKNTPIVSTAIGGRQLAANILTAETCLSAWQESYARDWIALYSPPELPPAAGDIAGTLPPKISYDYGRYCGAFTVSLPPYAPKFGAARRQALADLVGKIRSSGVPKSIAEQFRTADAGTLTDTNAALTVMSHLPYFKFTDDLRTWGDEYDSDVAKAAGKFATEQTEKSRSGLVKGASEIGWPGMGLYYRALSQISSLTTGLTSETPEWREPSPSSGQQSAVKAVQTLRTMISTSAEDRASLAADLAAPGDATSDPLSKFLDPLSRSVGQMTLDSSWSDDPVAKMVSFGHNLLAAGFASVAVMTGAAAASGNIFASVTGISAGVQYAMGWADLIIKAVLLVGTVHAYVLPMVPFIMSIFALLRWGITVIAAMLSAGLWAFTFIQVDGENFTSEQQQRGLLLLVEVCLAPPLYVLAFCALYYIQPYMLNYINMMWGTAYYGNQGGHFVGLFGWVVGIIMLTFVQWTVSIRMFSFIHEIQDIILRILGISSSAGQSDGGGVAAATAGAVALAQRGGGASIAPKPSHTPQKPSGSGRGHLIGIVDFDE